MQRRFGSITAEADGKQVEPVFSATAAFPHRRRYLQRPAAQHGGCKARWTLRRGCERGDTTSRTDESAQTQHPGLLQTVCRAPSQDQLEYAADAAAPTPMTTKSKASDQLVRGIRARPGSQIPYVLYVTLPTLPAHPGPSRAHFHAAIPLWAKAHESANDVRHRRTEFR